MTTGSFTQHVPQYARYSSPLHPTYAPPRKTDSKGARCREMLKVERCSLAAALLTPFDTFRIASGPNKGLGALISFTHSRTHTFVADPSKPELVPNGISRT